jgi:predicted TIM-barrel fold metal-dependent hydrolase
MTDIIDAHVHVWTPDGERYPLAPGFTREQIRPPSFTPEELLAMTKPHGVKRIVLIQVSYYGWDNSYTLHSLHRFPGVFSAVAVIDWSVPKPDEEMARMVKQGVRGFRIRSGDTPAENWMETESIDRMFRFAADHNVAICPLMVPSALPSLSRMCAKHLKTRVVIDHLCRVGGDGEVREADVHALTSMAHFPEVRLKVSAFYQLGKKKPPHDDLLPLIRQVYDAFGPRRLMWASDSPLQELNETYLDSLTVVRDRCSWLTEDDKEWMLRKTAEQVFFG